MIDACFASFYPHTLHLEANFIFNKEKLWSECKNIQIKLKVYQKPQKKNQKHWNCDQNNVYLQNDPKHC